MHYRVRRFNAFPSTHHPPLEKRTTGCFARPRLQTRQRRLALLGEGTESLATNARSTAATTAEGGGFCDNDIRTPIGRQRDDYTDMTTTTMRIGQARNGLCGLSERELRVRGVHDNLGGVSILFYVHSSIKSQFPRPTIFLQNLFRQCIRQWFNHLVNKTHPVLNYH